MTKDKDIDRAVIELCARAGHEVNRAFCIAMNDKSHPPWDDCPDWHKQSCRVQATFALQNKSPEEAHEAWRAEKVAAGWTYGEKRDPSKSEHPALMPFGDLPPEQRIKVKLAGDVYKATAEAYWRIPNQ